MRLEYVAGLSWPGDPAKPNDDAFCHGERLAAVFDGATSLNDPLMPVDSDEDAVRLMNDSRYGLTASVWTEDIARGESLAHRVAAGTVYVNRCDFLDPELAWAGIKDSGHGCTLSHLGFLYLTRPKSFHLRIRTND